MKRRRRAVIMCAVTFAAIPPQASRAASWSLTPQAYLSAGRDSNVRLSAIDEIESDTAILQLKGTLQRAEETLALSLIPQLTVVRYNEQSVLNRDDFSASANGLFRQERNNWSITATYVNDTTLTSELGSTGLTESAKEHENVSAAVTANWILDERWSTDAQSSWSAHTYESSAAGLVDYDYGSALTRTTYALLERSAISLEVSFGRLWVPVQRRHSDNYSINAAWQFSVTERWKVSAGVGPTRVDGFGFSDNGIGYSAGVEQSSELGKFQVSAARDVIATGRGVLSKRERVLLSASRSITERMSADLSAQWGRNEDLFPTLGLRLGVLRYAQIECGAQWRITPTVGVFASFNWLRQESDVLGDGTAESFRGGLGISWHGLRRDF